MAGHVHSFYLVKYEDGILKGTCQCGEIKYEVAEYTPEYVARAAELNKTLGVKGRNMEQEEGNVTRKGPDHLKESRNRRGQKCLKCEYGHEHDGHRFCEVPVCPSRVPRDQRAAFRPKTEETPPNSVPAPAGVSKTIKPTPEPRRGDVIILPLFSDSWTEVVQLKWLDTFKELALEAKE
ncbi:MAG: hypothetical protein PHQ43_10335 [Dehalococcoidales bacterium]|nr:hypothetical protein [Dehalococcoidales bacterium]